MKYRIHILLVSVFLALIMIPIAGCNTPEVPQTPYTGPVTIGAWVGELSIPIGKRQTESADIRMMITKNGSMIDHYQIYLTSCGWVTGDHSISVNEGTFTFSIDHSCNYQGEINFHGVFISEDHLEGKIEVGSEVRAWKATVAD